ncbi:hypothetical protein QOT17_016750 [Balamuthia mandrillaris]
MRRRNSCFCMSSNPEIPPSSHAVLLLFLLHSCLLACCVTSASALACGQHSWSTVPTNPAPGEPFVLNLAIRVWKNSIPDFVCVLTLQPHPYFDAWATDGSVFFLSSVSASVVLLFTYTLHRVPILGTELSVPTPPPNFFVKCQNNRCMAAGEGVFSAQKHFNLPLSAVQPSPLMYSLAGFSGTAQYNALDIKIAPRFTLKANFTAKLPPAFVPGQRTVFYPSFNVSSSGPSLVKAGYCLVSVAPLSVLDREALPPTCGDGPNGTIRCNFQNNNLPPATIESFAFRTVPLGPSARDKITVEVPSCNNAAGNELDHYSAPDPLTSAPSPDIHLAFSLTNKSGSAIVPGELAAIGFNLSNSGQSTSLATTMTWDFPPNLTIIHNSFTRTYCCLNDSLNSLSCTLDVKPNQEVESQVLVLADSSLAGQVMDFWVDCKDELKKELPKTKGQLQVTPFSNDVLLKTQWLSPSNMSTQREYNKDYDFAVEAKSEGPSWARQVGCFFNFTVLHDDSSLAETTFSTSLPQQACLILTDTIAAKHVLCQVGDLSTSTWTSFRFALSSKQPLGATKVEIGCRSSTPNNFPLVSWSAVLGDGGAKPSIDPGAGETASQFPDNTPNLQLVPKQGAAPQEHLRLDFVFHSIRELDEKGEEVRKMSFPSSGYHSSFLDERTIAFLWEVEADEKKEEEEEGRKRVEWTFTVVEEEEKEFHVGNRTFKVGAGFTKWSVMLSGWPPSNLTSPPSSSSSSSPSAEHWRRGGEAKKEEKRGKWLEMKVSMKSLDGGLTLQHLNHSLLQGGGGTRTRGVWRSNHTQVAVGLLQVCLVDGRERAAFARVEEEEAAAAAGEEGGEGEQWLVIRMPLGQDMFYDPDVQVLVDATGGGERESGVNVKLVVAVSVSVGVALCAVVSVLSGAVVWRRRKVSEISASMGAVNFSGEEFSMEGGAEYAPLLEAHGEY